MKRPSSRKDSSMAAWPLTRMTQAIFRSVLWEIVDASSIIAVFCGGNYHLGGGGGGDEGVIPSLTNDWRKGLSCTGGGGEGWG